VMVFETWRYTRLWLYSMTLSWSARRTQHFLMSSGKPTDQLASKLALMLHVRELTSLAICLSLVYEIGYGLVSFGHS